MIDPTKTALERIVTIVVCVWIAALTLGLALYFAFDIGESLTEDNHEQLEGLLSNSIEYVKPEEGEGDEVFAGGIVPMERYVKSLVVPLDIRVLETVPAEVEILEAFNQGVIDDNTITWNFSIGAEEDTNLYYIVKLPNIPGTYTFITDVTYLVNGIWYEGEGESITSDISISETIHEKHADALDLLIVLRDSVSCPGDEAHVNNAIRIMEKLDLEPETLEEKEHQIFECLKAITNHLVKVESADTSEARLAIIRLLIFFEMNH